MDADKNEHDELEFNGNTYESSSFSSINVRIGLEERKKLNGTDKETGLMDIIYQRNIGKLRNPYKLCKRRESSSHRYEWKQQSKRSIPFQLLRTPPTDAVLALDRTGSYMLAIGDGRRSFSTLRMITSSRHVSALSPTISLRLYGESKE